MKSNSSMGCGPARALTLVPAIVVLAVAMSSHANASTGVDLFNTGVSGAGAKLGGGSLDPHWEIVAGPGITTPQQAVVVNNQHPLGQYFTTLDSTWIWVNASGNGATHSPYRFREYFDLGSIDPSRVSISGEWGVDNVGKIQVNGLAPVGSGIFYLPLVTGDNFNLLHGFTITGGLHQGMNYLDFLASDDVNPGGLNVTGLTVHVTAVPEPSTLAFCAMGCAVLLGLRKRLQPA